MDNDFQIMLVPNFGFVEMVLGNEACIVGDYLLLGEWLHPVLKKRRVRSAIEFVSAAQLDGTRFSKELGWSDEELGRVTLALEHLLGLGPPPTIPPLIRV